MIEDKMTVRITEAELARDLHAVLDKVQQGSEVIVEREDHRPVAVIRSPNRSGRPIAEILRDARQNSSTVTLDEDFGKDLEEIIAAHRQPWNPPSWD
jgi:antitoxin (DNA-binding transcriptional repressor) of toxin-antitoxin stability system